MEKLPKIFNQKFVASKHFSDPYCKIDIKELLLEPESLGATHFELEVERDWEGSLEGFEFSFYQLVEETDKEYEQRMALIAKRVEEEQKRQEEFNKKVQKQKEEQEYQQYLSLKRKYEK